MELGKLTEKTGDEGCSSNEFACGDDDLPVCTEMDNDNWQSVFLDELTMIQRRRKAKKTVMMKLRMIVLNKRSCPALNHTKTEAIVAPEDIVLFLQQKACAEVSLRLCARWLL